MRTALSPVKMLRWIIALKQDVQMIRIAASMLVELSRLRSLTMPGYS